MARKKRCSGCRKPLDTKGRYCRKCRAEYMRKWRSGRVYVKRSELEALRGLRG